MKRDMDLVRKILLEIEAQDNPYFRGRLQIEADSEEQFYYHLALMSDAGLIIREEKPTMNGPEPLVAVKRMTWKGHEFLDASRDDTRWEKAKGIAGKMGGVTIDIFIEILKRVAMGQVNELIP